MDRRLLALGSDEIEKIRMSCSVRPVVQKFNKMTSLDDLAGKSFESEFIPWISLASISSNFMGIIQVDS